MAQTRSDDRSLGDLFSELTREISTLFRQEVALAKTEMTQKASKAGRDVASIAIGGAVAYAGFLAIVAAAILLLAEVVDWWLSALIIGVLVLAVGGLLIQRGREALKQEDMAPRQTIDSVKEDAEWLKRQM